MRARELQTSQWGISAEPDIIIQMLFVCLQWRTSSFSYVRPDTWRIFSLLTIGVIYFWKAGDTRMSEMKFAGTTGTTGT